MQQPGMPQIDMSQMGMQQSGMPQIDMSQLQGAMLRGYATNEQFRKCSTIK